MGTRCITEVRTRFDARHEFQTVAVIYRHWDGYPTGHGKDLFAFLNGLEIVNGVSVGRPMPQRYANGPDRMAAQLVCHLQEGGHNPALLADCGPCGQEFHYRIDADFENVTISVFDGPMTAFGMGGEGCDNLIFRGSVENFGKFLESEENT